MLFMSQTLVISSNRSQFLGFLLLAIIKYFYLQPYDKMVISNLLFYVKHLHRLIYIFTNFFIKPRIFSYKKIAR